MNLPVGWLITSLGEVARTQRARVHPRDAGEVPFIGLEHVESSTMRLLGTKPAADLHSPGFRFEPGDVLYGRLRPYLNKVHRPDFAGLASAEFIVLTPTSAITSDYLKYILSSTDFVRFASRLNTGDRPRVDFGQLTTYPIRLPPTQEQRAITRWLETVVTSLDACGKQLGTARKRQGAFERSLLRSTRGSGEGWRTARLPDVTVNRDGRRVPVRRSDRSKRKGAYPYYGASGIIDSIDDYLFDGDYLLVAEDGANLLARSTPIAFRATGRFWVNNHAHVLETTPDVDLRYLEFALNAIDLTQHVTGTAQPKLTQAALNRIEIALPDLDQQRAIAARIEEGLSIAENARTLLDSAALRMKALRAAAVQVGLSGLHSNGVLSA